MPDSHSIEKEFIDRITQIVLENISNEQFGVSELAAEIGMSRSNLLRKVKKITNVSVSQFINKVRLEQAMEILKSSSYTISEVSYQVGFGSVSYFIKCFREFYGYPPGEVNQRVSDQDSIDEKEKTGTKKKLFILVAALVGFIFIIVFFTVIKPVGFVQRELDKSIAVLPFKNESNDSTNVYFINGIMESLLTNLQRIENIKVISRTSVEKYRNSGMTIPEIAKELNVSYFVEGSGQKVGDQILLTIQLIEGPSDRHLWAEQYAREVTDIFEMQKEIAQNIAGEIEVIITPEEEERIGKAPTENMIAYDYFLKGLDLLHAQTQESLQESIHFFKEALNEDDGFARAYAGSAMAYYFLDEYLTEKKYSDSINYFADKALLYDSQLPQGLIAKGLYYLNTSDYLQAETYFKKSLEYSPNYDLAFAFLVDLYANYIPDTEKYLEYALKGMQLDISSYDSLTTSVIYLHLSNAFIQNGFIDEAEMYINKSLEYDPQNLYSEYVKAYILYARNRDLQQTKNLIVNALMKDTTRIDILQEAGKMCYYLRDYESAYLYYKPFIDVREAYNLNIYHSEDMRIGLVLSELGMEDDAQKLFESFILYAENDQSVYRHINLAMYYSYMGDKDKAIEHLRLFTQEDDYHYWTLIFMDIDPLVDNIKELPEFQNLINQMEERFWQRHERIKTSLEENKLI